MERQLWPEGRWNRTLRLFISRCRSSSPEGITPDLTESGRRDVRWALERRLEDIESRKKEHWLFAYTTIGALSALCFALISQPAWLRPVFGWTIAAGSVLLYFVWAAAHCATNAALINGRDGKDICYAMLGDPLEKTRARNAPFFNILPPVLAVAVTIVFAVTLIAGILEGTGYLAKSSGEASMKVMCVAGSRGQCFRVYENPPEELIVEDNVDGKAIPGKD